MFIVCPRVDWSGRHLTPTGVEERSRPRRRYVEEARLPPRGKQVPAAERNGLASDCFFNVIKRTAPVKERHSVYIFSMFTKQSYRVLPNPLSDTLSGVRRFTLPPYLLHCPSSIFIVVG